MGKGGLLLFIMVLDAQVERIYARLQEHVTTSDLLVMLYGGSSIHYAGLGFTRN